eukprot:8827540-Alexandrium_andersonii.AAC.1
MIPSLAVEAPREARRLHGRGQNHGGADVLGVRAWDRPFRAFLRARPADSRSWILGPCIGFEIT